MRNVEIEDEEWNYVCILVQNGKITRLGSLISSEDHKQNQNNFNGEKCK